MADRTGQRLDNYRLVRLLGEGSFGQVYLAEHIFRETQVAVKVLPHLADDDLPDFLNEARTIRLRHPHIVQILDFGVDKRIPFIVMEYIANGTLRQRFPKGSRLPLDLIVLYVKQVAGALQYAHDEKLIHRDVKSENMLLRSDNDVLLSDFGIATFARSSGSHSILGMAGTITYMAPEQLHGRPVLASDQYSLGVVAYEWLCGERPFKGSPMEIATQHMLKPTPPLREKVPKIPPSVEQVVLTALEKEPKNRFPNIQAFAIALERATRIEPPSVGALQTIQPPAPAPIQSSLIVERPSTVAPLPPEIPVPTSPLPARPMPTFATPPSQSPPSPLRLSNEPLTSSPDSIIAPQAALVKPKPGRGRLFYSTIALIAILIITLTSGGVFYFLRANESQTVNQILDTTQQQINAANPANPTTALNALSTAQKTLRDLQNNHQLDAAQMQRVAALQNQLVMQVNAAISTYNHNAKISVLTCPSNPIDNASARTFPQSIAYAQNAQGGPFLYALAQDKSIYQITHQNNQDGMVNSSPSGKPSPTFLSLASNGSLLFVVEKQGTGYALGVFQPGAQGGVGAPIALAQLDPSLTNGGYVPTLTSAWGMNVYVVFSSTSNPSTARILSYVLDTNGNLSTPKETNFSIAAPLVSIAAFPDQLFLLLSTGNVQSLPLVNGSLPSSLTTPVLVQPPIAQPLTMSGFTTSDVVPTVTPNNQQGSAALSVPSASPANPALLIASQVNRKPHLYIGDPVNHRVLDLDAGSGVPASPSPVPTGINVPSSVTLQLEQQYVSSTSFNQLKSLAADPQGTKLTVLSQNTSPIASLVSISNGTPPSCVT